MKRLFYVTEIIRFLFEIFSTLVVLGLKFAYSSYFFTLSLTLIDYAIIDQHKYYLTVKAQV